MRILCSYGRLFIASWLFMGGLSLQFLPTPTGMARDSRWRERQLQAVPVDQQAKWLEDRDDEDARSFGYLRLFGVTLGGVGFAMALRETAYLCSRYSR